MSTTLLCWVVDTDIHKIFPVEIKNNAIWGGVKDDIKVKKKPEFDDIAADALDLWKVTMKPSERKSRLGSALYLEGIVTTEPLDSIKSVLTDFHPPPDDHIHIIIVRRPRAQSPKSDSNRGFSIDAHWSRRADTVCRLFDVLQNERLVHVRGTPGSGKTTLKELLHAHITKTYPSSYVYTVDSWPPSNAPEDSDLTAKLRLVDPAYPQPNSPTFLLFDDGQDTYKDEHLWNTFFKRVHDGLDNYYAVLFCSYGSPSASPLIYRKGGPPLLRSAARVSLWHEKHSIGLLLNPTEFDEVVEGYANKPERKLMLDPKLKAHFYDLTGGHVGAVVELLHLISYQRVPETRNRVAFTVDAFMAENPTPSLMQRLNSGAFGRGLPQPPDFKKYPHITGFFQNLIRHSEFEEGVVEDAAAQFCHRRGWLHSYMNKEGSTHYTFSSPLHSVYISWLLAPSNNMPTYPSAFELCLAAISNFKPSQMHIPIRRVGAPSPITRLPEAQYQDEFYRAVFSVTAGSVCISPEFASAKWADVVGRIDFFVPVVKWGIEIVRDGNRLFEHNSRFKASGAYGAWLKSGDMADYILLDCRTSVPQMCHPNIPNLFHAVFENDYKVVTLYDNQSRKVGDAIALLENHF